MSCEYVRAKWEKRHEIYQHAVMATAAMMATGAFAQDIAVIAGSVEDAFMDKIKVWTTQPTWSAVAKQVSIFAHKIRKLWSDLVTLISKLCKGDGIAIPVWVPDAQIPALQSAAAEGIKIMQYNSGLPVKADIGAINYFGSDEYAAGFGGGKYLAEKGAKHILCHIQFLAR